MNNLFVLYRHLVSSKNIDDSYDCALRTLEKFLDIFTKLEDWGQIIHDRGNIECSEADEIVEEMCTGAEALLCEVYDTPTDAVMDFIKSHEMVNLDRLVTFIDHLKAQAQQMHNDDGALLSIDDYPF